MNPPFLILSPVNSHWHTLLRAFVTPEITSSDLPLTLSVYIYIIINYYRDTELASVLSYVVTYYPISA